MEIKNFDKGPEFLKELIEDIKSIVDKAKNTIETKVNAELLKTYWTIGKLIVDREASENITSRSLILDLSKELTKQLGKGFSRSNLFNMRNFFQKYPDVQTVSGHLSWSHYCELLSIESDDKRSFYEKETINSKWSIRELKRQIDSSLYERLILSKGQKNKQTLLRLSKEGQIIEKPGDIIGQSH